MKKRSIPYIGLLILIIGISPMNSASEYINVNQDLSDKKYYQQETIMDYDGNIYRTVKIGNQIWMAENLRSVHYLDGTEIMGVFTYHNQNNVKKYGRLYTWEALTNEHGICPEGWHIPKDSDWQKLEYHLGMRLPEIENTGWRGTHGEGLKLKEDGEYFLTKHSKKNKLNESGFSALPCGTRTPAGLFLGRKYYADFWSATEKNADKAMMRSLVWLKFHPDNTGIYRNAANKKWCFAVRLMKD